MTERLASALLGRYRFDRPLGAGGMADVYLARDVKHDRDVAIKVFRDEMAASVGIDRFLAEIRTTARLSHPHILPLHDSGEADGCLYYVMPFVDGETLRHRMDRERIALDEAVTITRSIGDALAYAHAHGVVHRDIKPENIFLHSGHALVADFGIARERAVEPSRRMTSPGIAIGTPAYMSPEQAAGDDVDARTDQYALASVLYEMIVGEPPFAGPSVESMLVQRFTLPPPKVTAKRPDVPLGIEAAICTAMARNPDERFSNISAFTEMLGERAGRISRLVNDRSIAVLPFANMSGEEDNEYFSDGISEEIVSAIARLPGLRVTARTSAFSYKGKNVDLRTIGDQLGVANILEGSVRRSGNRIRITAQLINVADGYQLWSERYDRELTDVFAIQEEIATAIAAKLDVALTSRETLQILRPPTANVAAYDAYLKGRSFMQQRGATLAIAVEAFERAIALDPNFCAAHAYLALTTLLASLWGVVPLSAVRRRAGDAIDSALAHGPDLLPAHIATGLLALCNFDRAKASEAWTRAVELDPSDADARAMYALYDLGYIRGAFDDAIEEMSIALEADPRSAHIHAHMSLLLAWGGRFSTAEAEARLAIELEPQSLYAAWALVHALNLGGNLDQGRAAAESAMMRFGRHPWLMMAYAIGLGRSGHHDLADALYLELEARSRTTYVQPVTRAMAALGTGRTDDLFRLLNEAAESGDPVLALVAGHWSALDDYRERDEFKALLRRIGWDRPLAPAMRPPRPPARA